MSNEKLHNRTETKTRLVNGAWLFAHTLLWHGKEFNEAEIEIAKQQIEECIIHPSLLVSREKFIMFCERVLLAHQYLQRNESRFVPHPLKWLSPHFEHGYAGTKAWYLDMVHERKYIVVHRFELKVFAESYYLFMQKPCRESFQKALQALKTYADETLIQQFNNLIINHTYNN
ncbi:MAG: hypothetical protein JNM95_12145 [Chitinophagaceae bacterium]|nr:hypothetical protein [Chitinophagaceae bacterium]